MFSVLYHKQLTNDKQLPAFSVEDGLEYKLPFKRCEEIVLPFFHVRPLTSMFK